MNTILNCMQMNDSSSSPKPGLTRPAAQVPSPPEVHLQQQRGAMAGMDPATRLAGANS